MGLDFKQTKAVLLTIVLVQAGSSMPPVADSCCRLIDSMLRVVVLLGSLFGLSWLRSAKVL